MGISSDRSIQAARRARRFRLVAVALGVLCALPLAEAALWLAAAYSPRVANLTTPPWRRGSIPDPVLHHRGTPLLDGHDADGFRNPAILTRCDILTIGDSMTYGYAAEASDSWPAQLERLSGLSVYNVGFGGYGPCEYQELLKRKLSLEPSTIIVALYPCNDLADAYRAVWVDGRFTEFRSSDPEVARAIAEADRRVSLEAEVERLDQRPGAARRPRAWHRYLAMNSKLYSLAREGLRRLDGARNRPIFLQRLDEEDTFERSATRPGRTPLDLPDSRRTVLMSLELLKLGFNLDDPRIAEGLTITERAIEVIQRESGASEARLLFVIIPTKQRVYLPLLRSLGHGVAPQLADLVAKEEVVTARLEETLTRLGIETVDVLPHLRAALERGERLFPESDDEHPAALGYAVIARELAQRLRRPEETTSERLLPPRRWSSRFQAANTAGVSRN